METLKVNDTAVVSRVISFDNQLKAVFDDFHQDLINSKNKALGKIYSDADINKLIRELRPKFVYNFFVPVLLGLVGNIKNNLPKIDILPTTEDDIRGVQLQQKLLDYYLYQANDIDYELAKAYLFALIMKIGWLTVEYGYNKNPDGMVEINFTNPLQIKFDPNWSRKDMNDCKYITSYAWLTPEEIVQKYAARDSNFAEELFDEMNKVIGYDSEIRKSKVTSWTTRLFGHSRLPQTGKTGYEQDNYFYKDSYYQNGLFKVIDHYEVLAVPTMRLRDLATGESLDITDEVIKKDYEINPATTLSNWYDNDKLQMIRAKYQEPVITTGYREQKFMFSVIPHIHKMLYADKLKVQRHFKHIPLFALDIGIDATETLSMIDIISDPVTSYNLRRNTMLTYLMRMSNKGYIAEEWAIDGYEDMFENKKIGAIKKVKAGALTKGAIEEEKLPQFPEALSRYADQDKEDLWTLSSVTPNYLGKQESAQESGVLYNSRVERSDVLQTWFIDNLKNALVMVGEQAIATGQRFIRSERVLRIITEENQPEFLIVNKYALGQIINDVGAGYYDLRVSKSPSGKFAKEIEFEKLISMAQFIAGTFGAQFIDLREILKASNLYNKNELIRHVDKIMQQESDIATIANIFNFQKELQNIAQSKIQQQLLSKQLQINDAENPVMPDLKLAKQDKLLNNIGV